MLEIQKPDFFSGSPSAEEKRALDDLFSLVYEELRRVASVGSP